MTVTVTVQPVRISLYHVILVKMAAVRILDFQIFTFSKFLVTDRVGTANVHHRANFIEIDQIIAEILQLTTVKTVALCHLEFLKI